MRLCSQIQKRQWWCDILDMFFKKICTLSWIIINPIDELDTVRMPGC